MDILILYFLTAYLIWSILFNKLFVAKTRHKLFLIRDKAFLEQEHDEEYYRFREDINMLIRFAERVSWQRIAYDTLFLFKHIPDSTKKNIKLPEYTNKELNKYFFVSMFLIGKLVVQKSIILFALFSVMIFLGMVKHYFKKQSDKVFGTVEQIRKEQSDKVVDAVEQKLFTDKARVILFEDARQSDFPLAA